jgi:hypothetical protein
LFQPIKQMTADLQRLDAETCRQPPFSDLPTLASRIQDQFCEGLFGLAEAVSKTWMAALGQGIARIELDEQEKQVTVRQLGHRLAGTRWQAATGLESVPYIDGTPAGTARRIDVLWKEDRLFVDDRPVAHLFRAITQELARVFERSDIGDAIRACVERSPEFIREYLEENFRLSLPEAVAAQPQPVADTSSDDSGARDVAINDEEDTDTPDQAAADSGEADDGGVGDGDDDQGIDGDVGDDDGANIEIGVDVSDDDDGDFEQPEDTEYEFEGEDDSDNEDDHDTKPSPTRKTPKPHLIDLMAAAAGFTRDGSDRFFHPDGGWIQKVSGNTFQWERYSAVGDLVQSYWVKDCCIEREALQLDAAIWNLCERSPEQYSIVLRDPSEKAVVYSGADLVRLRANDRLKLYPANYRLVYHHSDTSSSSEGSPHG